MPSVDVHQCLRGNQAKPDKDGTRGVEKKVINSLQRGQPRLLKNIIRVHSTMQPRIHAEGHNSPKTIPMTGKKLRQRVLVALNHTSNQFRVILLSHESTSEVLPYNRYG
jgi:hypothetical protein